MRRFWFFKGFLFITGFIILGGFVVMGLWNWLMPVIFGLTTISFVQALGLLALSKILFGGFYGGKRWGGCEGSGRQFWKHRMAERMERMSPEDRDKMRERLQKRWSRWEEKRS